MAARKHWRQSTAAGARRGLTQQTGGNQDGRSPQQARSPRMTRPLRGTTYSRPWLRPWSAVHRSVFGPTPPPQQADMNEASVRQSIRRTNTPRATQRPGTARTCATARCMPLRTASPPTRPDREPSPPPTDGNRDTGPPAPAATCRCCAAGPPLDAGALPPPSDRGFRSQSCARVRPASRAAAAHGPVCCAAAAHG